MRVTLTLVALALVAGCSSGTQPPAVSAEGVWTPATVLRGTVTIPAGSTVTLAKGATVTAAEGAMLVVNGTLLAPSGGSLKGKDWGGLDVAQGGTATLSGVTIAGAEQTHVAGTLVGSHLTYDKGGSSGIVLSRGAVMRLSDSLLFGNGKYQGDMITTDSAKELTVSRTEIRDAHCAFHLVGIDALNLVGDTLHKNAYGFMAYGSKAGVIQRITSTDNYDNRDYGLLETPGVEQGNVVIDGGFWGRSGSGVATVIAQASGKITRLHPATAPRSGAAQAALPTVNG